MEVVGLCLVVKTSPASNVDMGIVCSDAARLKRAAYGFLRLEFTASRKAFYP